MTPFLKSLLLLGLLTPLWSFAQFQTANPNGNIGAGEYGLHVNGQNQQFEGGTTWYMSWDANNLYVAFSGSNYNEGAVLYLDRNAIVPVNGGNGGNGSVQGYYTYDRNHMLLPFRADFVLYYKNGYHEYRYADGGGYWGGQTSNTLAVGTNGGSNTVEIAIPWNVVTQGAGRPASFNWMTYKAYDYGAGTNGVYHSVPVGNPNCACNQNVSVLNATRYYNVLNTGNGVSTLPFSTQSFTYYENNSTPGTGGYYLTNSTFYDLTVNDNSGSNTDNDPGNRLYNNNEISNRVLVEGAITITHDLYVGMGSALLPADNVGPNVLATVSFTGGAGSIYNYGRIDANPEAGNAVDCNNRRMDLRFAGTTRLQASPLFKDNWRISNVQVLAGASLLGPLTDSVALELQFGTFDNQGTVDLGNGLAGFADMGTRGDWSLHNDYYLSGGGTWRMHRVLIGRNSSRLLPAVGTTVRLLVQGDFENYDEFAGKNGTGRIDVVMAGRKRQYLRGNVLETSGASTSFHNLEIDNTNLLGDWNNSADVWFESSGGGNVQYFVTGSLTVRNGDLVTRDRLNNQVHVVTLRDSAVTVNTFLHHNLSTVGSAFVDGPLSWEVENTNLVIRDFPVGKSKLVSGYLLGEVRPLRLEVDHDAVTRTTYTAEMHLDDRSTFYNWPSAVPEVIVWISQQRYWNVTKGAGANVEGAFVTLSYDVAERPDGVTNAAALRIVKDNGAGDWVNVTPLGPGGVGNGTGVIRSHAFTSFSDFTLASIDGNMPLPMQLLGFEAHGEDGYAALRWRTAQEVNSDRFVVERSVDREHFEGIGEVEAAGFSHGNLDYGFEDQGVGTGLYHYRLRMVDRDGGAAYSEIRSVVMGGEKGLVVYPNPSAGVCEILVSGVGDGTEGKVFDGRGVEVGRFRIEGGRGVLRGLSAGMYWVRVGGVVGKVVVGG